MIVWCWAGCSHWSNASDPAASLAHLMAEARDSARLDECRRLVSAATDYVLEVPADVIGQPGDLVHGVKPDWLRVLEVAITWAEDLGMWAEATILAALHRIHCEFPCATTCHIRAYLDGRRGKRLRQLLERPEALDAFLADLRAASPHVARSLALASRSANMHGELLGVVSARSEPAAVALSRALRALGVDPDEEEAR